MRINVSQYVFRRWGFSLPVWTAILPVLLLTSCAVFKPLSSESAEEETTGVVEAETQPQGQAAPAVAQAQEPPPFTLGVGDEVSISVWGQDDLTQTSLRVDPSGNICIHLAGEIKAAGLSASELRLEVTRRLSEFFVNPRVALNVETIRSRKVHVLGEVGDPGTFPLDAKMFVLEAISRAGGFTNDANSKSVLLVRDQSGAAEVTALDLTGFVKTGRLDQNLYLQAGDLVYVPPRKVANVERFANRLSNIISPFLGVERGIIFAPEVIDALQGDASGDVTIAQ